MTLTIIKQNQLVGENVVTECKNIAGTRIREARKSESPCATQGDISARLMTLNVPLSVASISKMELGEQPITDVQLMAFAKALKVKAAWLLGESEDKR